MKNHNKSLFNKSVRGLSHYEKLKDDIFNKSENILISLPLFVRLILTEKSSWFSEFNKFDFLCRVRVNSNIHNIFYLTNTIGIYNNIKSTHLDFKYIPVKTFLDISIVKISNINYSIQEFLNAIAYNGGLHNSPDKANIKEFYEKFHMEFFEIAMDLVFAVGDCFVESFSDIYEKFKGNNDASSSEFGREPLLVVDGVVTFDKHGMPTSLFSNSHLQLPIRAKFKCGIRFCLQIKLNANKNGCIFSYGHRTSQNLNLSCCVVGGNLVIKTISKFIARVLSVEVPLLPEYFTDFFWLEVAIYPAGNLSISVNEYLKRTEKIPSNFCIENGKMILGSDLNGNNSADFYAGTWVIESINSNNKTDFIFASSNKNLNTLTGNIIPFDLICRPLSVY